MLTPDQIIEYGERVIAENRLSGDKLELKNIQRAAGFLMAAAEAYGDTELVRRFRILAAQAANRAEELE